MYFKAIMVPYSHTAKLLLVKHILCRDQISTIRNLKELRLQHSGKPYRILYAFDPKRSAVLLCGGRKNGKKDKLFYKRMIYLAEKVFARYLKDEGLL